MPDLHLPQVVVVGGGAGAIEAVLALRALGGKHLAITLVAPDETVVYRPLAVLEPFGGAPARPFPLAKLSKTHGAHVVRDAVAAVEPREYVVRLAGGGHLRYDALVVAVGARQRPWLLGALTFRGGADADAYRALLEELASGATSQVLFAGPPGVSWTLPLYELALLTATWVADHHVHDARLTLATTEPMPLAAFGGAAARTVVNLLGDRGIELVAGCLVAPDADGRVDLHRFGTLRPDRIVTLPRLAGNPLPGRPADHEGFVPVDAHARVVGLLLTGVASAYLRRDPAGAGGEASQAAYRPLWWPPAKIAGRYLAPYLADQTDPLGPRAHRAAGVAGRRSRARPSGGAPAGARVRRRGRPVGRPRVGPALAETIEWLDGVLSPELEARRDAWRREVAAP